MSRIAEIKWNDTVNGPGIRVSLFMQGCPHHCFNCFNKDTWDFEGGNEIPYDIKGQIIKGIGQNEITRGFSVLGGEPLCEENQEFVKDIITAVRTAYPKISIYLWTGYTLEELKEKNSEIIKDILSKIDVLIDGRFEEDKKDLSLELRGSSNQRILKNKIDF